VADVIETQQRARMAQIEANKNSMVAGIRRLMRGEPVDLVTLSRRVAASVIARGGYPV